MADYRPRARFSLFRLDPSVRGRPLCLIGGASRSVRSVWALRAPLSRIHASLRSSVTVRCFAPFAIAVRLALHLLLFLDVRGCMQQVGTAASARDIW